ncbi:MAG: carboxypeptidase regulatory-like domain-containing protein, partial [Saprospiraceae bacterium]
TGPRPFLKAHTLFIDEFGLAYLNGTNVNSGGVVIVDVKNSPTDPVFLGYAPPIYSHDVYARDSILYSAEIYPGDLSIYDVHDPQNVTLLGKVKTPYEFTHNAWLSDDSRYMYTTDERANAYVAAYDIQDPANIVEVDRFRQAAVEGKGAIPHNVYVLNDFLVIAYYSSGTLIVDASRPNNLVEVGSFDSFLGPDGDYEGVWGSYPFLPSGKILSSDRSTGLYVLIPNYVRAAFLEGVVLDSITKTPIQGATVSIISDEIVLPELTRFDGTFKTGKAIPGTYNILVTKTGYYPKTIQGEFINGVVLTPTVELNALPVHSFSGKVIDNNGGNVSFAKVLLSGPDGIYELIADADGNFSIPAVYEGLYEVQAGVWGFTTETEIFVNAPQNITLTVQPGYIDDFDLDLGWLVGGHVDEGEWKRGILGGQRLWDVYQCGSTTDSPFDMGKNLYSTGLAPTQNAAIDEVSGGTTVLISPSMNLINIFEPVLSFDYWLCEYPPNQYIGFKVYWTNSIDTVLIDSFSNPLHAGTWTPYTFPLNIDGPKDNVQILFEATDTTQGTGDYYLKVHVDNFKVIEGTTGVHDDYTLNYGLLFYPNPVTTSHIDIKTVEEIEGNEILIRITDANGRMASSFKITVDALENGFNHQLADGIYFIRWESDKGETGVEKILVMKK